MGTLIEPREWNRVPIERREAAFNEVSEIFYHLYPEIIQNIESRKESSTNRKKDLHLWALMQELREQLQISVIDEVES
jgi:hypothetical protein